MTLSLTLAPSAPVAGTRVTRWTMTLAGALHRIRRSGGDLLPAGPAPSGPWAGRPDLDRDGDRIRSDLRALSRAHGR